MQVDLVVKNYRSFSDEKPLRLDLRPGFTALVGPNNSGKSSILKLFYELRHYFGELASPDNLVQRLQSRFGGRFEGVAEPAEVFSNVNDRDLTLEFTFQPDEFEPPPPPRSVTLHIERGSPNARLELTPADGQFVLSNPSLSKEEGRSILASGSALVDLQPVVNVAQAIASSVYIGPFRNAINVGEGNYYDLPVGWS